MELRCITQIDLPTETLFMVKPQSFSQLPLYSFLRWFVTPRILPEDAEEGRRAKLILGILFFLFLTSVANILLWTRAGSLDIFSVFIFFLFGSLYFFAKLISYEWGIRSTILIFLAIPYLYLLSEPSLLDIFTLLFVGFLALILASIFTNFRNTLLVAIFNFATIFAVNIIISEASPLESLSLVIPVLLLTLLLLLNAYYRRPNAGSKNGHSYDFYPEAVLIQVDKTIVYANPWRRVCWVLRSPKCWLAKR
jgi:hypothetical protein